MPRQNIFWVPTMCTWLNPENKEFTPLQSALTQIQSLLHWWLRHASGHWTAGLIQEFSSWSRHEIKLRKKDIWEETEGSCLPLLLKNMYSTNWRSSSFVVKTMYYFEFKFFLLICKIYWNYTVWAELRKLSIISGFQAIRKNSAFRFSIQLGKL